MTTRSTQPRFQVIGLTGPADAGKDTAARLLHVHAGFYVLAFADALRSEVTQAFGIDLELLTERSTKELPSRALALDRCRDDGFVGAMLRHFHQREQLITDAELEQPRSPRTIMQWWGTEYRRASMPDYWVRAAARRITQLNRMQTAHQFVVTDVRFQNEAEMVRSFGGLLWQIRRPGRGTLAGAHVSDVTGDEFRPHTVIDNRYDVRHLQQQVLSAWWGHDGGFPAGAVSVEIEE